MRRAFSLAILVALVAGGCADTRDAPETTEVASDADVVQTICDSLRAHHDSITGVANEAVAGINARTPSERTEAIVDGFDDAIAQAERFATEVPGWDIPAIAEREALLDEVSTGASAAVEELTDERDRFVAEVDVVSDDDVFGRVGEYFNSIEKALSVVEPNVATLERSELRQAFLDEEGCAHVTQRSAG